MGRIFFSQSFWKTRFEYHGDRYFLGSPDGSHPKISRRGNWHLLYYCTHETVLSQRLCERRDIWWRCRLISGFMDTRLSLPGVECYRAMTDLLWQYLPLSQSFLGSDVYGTTVTYSRYFSLPHSLKQIAVSVLGDTRKTCITGMEFIGEAETVKIGYISSRDRIIRDIGPFQRIKIAWSREEVHAIKLKTNATGRSWIGTVPNTCCMCDLSVESNVVAMRIEFDVGVPSDEAVSMTSHALTLWTGLQNG
ncbi:hypothetical protein BDV37DRAFT_497 [Aspergillus pseudonomiae]|uniref:DUF7600 domain-containing protein n=1 Tax=Aspergillus pseudonomiae TaxID=1506151 RepID=A0A5N7DUS8_9EURO|nr:uncharacterized protein BDV37DRAFT_497 [Aspergillus pseudonomiae]KAE8409783.1 hypothetical protein BDV37DRAFT_497 [Aspergillus pseudonomiae]